MATTPARLPPAAVAPLSNDERTGTTLVVLVQSHRGEAVADADVRIVRYEDRSPYGIISNEEQIRRAVARARAPQPDVARASTNAAGRAELTGLPGNEWYLVAEHQGYAPVGASARHWRRPPAPVRLVMSPGRTLRGRVLDHEGRPVPRAVVLVDTTPSSLGGWYSWPQRTAADAQGRYTFPVVPTHPLIVSSGRPGGTVRFVDVIRFPGLDRYDIVLPRCGRIEGRVEFEGAPVANADVIAIKDFNWQTYSTAVTNERGEYVIEDALPGRLSLVQASKAGFAQGFESHFPQGRYVRPGRTTRVDIALVRAARIRGRIRGVLGLRGTVSSTSYRPGGGNFHTSTKVQDDGSFELFDLPRGRHMLSLHAPGIAQVGFPDNGWQSLLTASGDESYIVDLVPGATVERDLAATRGRVTVQGIVERPNGAPFPGALVWAGDAHAITDAGGRFRIDGAKTGGGRIGVRADGFLQAEPFPTLELPMPDLRLRLRPAPRLVGRVRDAQGAIVPGATLLVWQGALRQDRQVDLRMQMRRLWYAARRQPVAADGTFDIRLHTGPTVFVRAEAPGYPWGPPVEIQLGNEKERHEVNLVLRAGHAVTGMVFAHGQPVASARILLRGPDWKAPAWIGTDVSPGATVAAVTASDGSFAIEFVQPGKWRVVASAPGFVGQGVETTVPGPAVRVELETTERMAGIVVDSAAKPIVGAHVNLGELDSRGRPVRRGQSIDGYVTDERGRFDIGNLKPGFYSVWVSYDAANIVGTRVRKVRSGTKDLRIEVQHALEISGRVIDARRRPVLLAGVHVDGVTGGSTQTADDGSFLLRGIPPGEYTITFSRAGLAMFQRRHITAGTRHLEVVWGEADAPDAEELARSIGGVVVDEQGQPVEHALVDTRSARVALADAQGRFLIEDLPPGTRSVSVYRDGFLRLETKVDTGRRDVRLVLKRGETVRGVVRDEQGQPVAEVSVRMDVGQRKYRGKDTDANGAFEIGGLPAGARGELRLGKLGYVVVKKQAAAGDANLAFTLRRGLKVTGRLVDQAGRPMGGVMVALRHVDDKWGMAGAKTDVSGNFEVSGLAPGEYNAYAIVDRKQRPCGRIRAGDTRITLVVSE